MNKKEEILKVSDPQIVRQLADKYLGKSVPIYLSNRKDKKYMVQNPDGKIIHFGAMKYEDYTKHQNEKRRIHFRQRNKKWQYTDKWTPAYLSWHLLWLTYAKRTAEIPKLIVGVPAVV
jgi:hypothetical protein